MKYIIFLLFSFSIAIYGKEPEIQVSVIGKNIYVHTSYKLLKDAYFPSNGLIVETEEGVVLVDTAWGGRESLKRTLELLEVPK
ncbi:hypothetical protein [Leptospira johnsonii]|uniref:Putative beta-lactamase Bla2 n=1 Tax=Leptospira johnsonii TaxID=1917820 RepID=A0A2P2D687_9LEPT|nr:hypothetical protein [Leptospira johnsonii]GBF40145.1 putative beta-lactamase Bla2 [Leptospira johnsonii]